ncbi:MULTISPECIES: NUDIX hydrolase [Pantoea]|uniref:NUDIX hydrolase n=1 Tax=Pantoea TaxID=53335 RepID=UPI0011A64FDF|nr:MULTISPECIES: NUDIX domain-containing protein [Pantoea]MDJ0039157.1 NUDIX domain-containing protein [Pantoea allii]TWD45017.1 ADP-ribose pyrophosphatase YjhB (NUDIX family) [Pantoea sp. SJZ147]
MRTRRSARLLILNASHAVLLFRFVHKQKQDALAGNAYWATPGGGVEEGESFEQAAVRELYEETGIRQENVGPSVGERKFEMTLPSGECVLAHERFYVVTVSGDEINTQGWSENEKSVIASARWWTIKALSETADTIYPANILRLLP